MADSKELKKLEEKIKELEDTIIKLKKGFNEAINELGIGNFSKQFIDKYLTTPDEIEANAISANAISASTVNGEVVTDLYSCLSEVVPMRNAHENGDDFNGEKEIATLMEYSEDYDYDDFDDTEEDSWDERILSFFGGRFKIAIKDVYAYSGDTRYTTKVLCFIFENEEYIVLEERQTDGNTENRSINFMQDTYEH